MFEPVLVYVVECGLLAKETHVGYKAEDEKEDYGDYGGYEKLIGHAKVAEICFHGFTFAYAGPGDWQPENTGLDLRPDCFVHLPCAGCFACREVFRLYLKTPQAMTASCPSIRFR